MDRFQEVFLRKLVELSKEYGFVIIEDGYVEPIGDWVTPGKAWSYTAEETEHGMRITGIEMS